jgi:hypothetical protein
MPPSAALLPIFYVLIPVFGWRYPMFVNILRSGDIPLPGRGKSPIKASKPPALNTIII